MSGKVHRHRFMPSFIHLDGRPDIHVHSCFGYIDCDTVMAGPGRRCDGLKSAGHERRKLHELRP